MRAYILIISTVAALFCSGCGKKYEKLAEKPLEKAPEATANASESRIALNALFPYEGLSKALTDALPVNIPIAGRQNVCVDVNEQVQKTIQNTIGGDVGKLFGQVARIVTTVVTVNTLHHVCEDIDYNAVIIREGPAVVSPLPNGVRLSIPIRAEGSAGFVGVIAEVTKLNKKNFRGSLTAWTDVSMSVDENWCPTVTASPDFSWRDKAQLEVVGRFWIDIDSQAGPKIKDAMNDAVTKIPAALTCGRVKELVAPLWHVYNISIPDIGGSPGRVIVTPKGAGFSGFGYTPTGAQLALMLVSQTEVRLGKAPESAQTALALPKLEKLLPSQDAFNLTVPITVEYETLQKAVSKALVDKTFSGSAGPTSGNVTIKAVEIYPSDERLVVGVKFESKISSPKSLAPNGWVYLMAKPNFDPDTQIFVLEDIGFSRIIDNDLWNALSFLFQNQIRDALQKAATVDLRPVIAKARESMKDIVSKEAAKEGINVNLDEKFLGLTKVTLTAVGAEVDVGFRGAANIIVVNMPIKPSKAP